MTGFTIGGGIRASDGSRVYGSPGQDQALQTISDLRRLAPDAVLIGSGGSIKADDAMSLSYAGAEFVQIYSGLSFTGPHLISRINRAVLINQKNVMARR